MFALREAWNLPLFWGVFAVLIIGTAYSVAKIVFGKIVLDSPKLTMTVYGPFKKEYKFSEINYVDRKIIKGGDGSLMHAVVVYIGSGKRSVEMASYSKDQAGELEILVRGMLDNAAMTYPEGNEEPFVFPERKDKKSEPKAEEPKAEEPKAAEKKPEDTKSEQPKAESEQTAEAKEETTAEA